MNHSPRTAIPRSPRTDADRPARPQRADELLVFELPSSETATQRRGRVPVPPYFTHAVLKPPSDSLFSPRPEFTGQAARNERKFGDIDGVTNKKLATTATKATATPYSALPIPPRDDGLVPQLASPPLPNSSDSFQVHFEPVPITPRITIVHATPDTNYSHSKYSTPSLAPPARRVLPPSSSRSPSDFEGVRDEKAWRSPTIDDSEWGDRSMLIDFDKVDLAASKFKGFFARLCFLLYPFYVLLHIPVTLFLDYKHLYIISQLALAPALPTSLAPRSLQVAKLDASTAWWIAIALYGLSTILWLIGIVIVRDFCGGYLKVWRFGGKRHVDLRKVYSRTAAFDQACLRSFSHFSFLYRARLSTLRKDEHGQRRLFEAVLESLSWYSQNWPTALLLLSRVGISLVILLLFQSTVYGSPSNRVGERDSSYFASNGILTSFASAVILTNLCWAAYRILLVALSLIGHWILQLQNQDDRNATRHTAYSNRFSASREVLHISNVIDSEGKSNAGSKFATRQNHRLRTAIDACAKDESESKGGTPLFGSSSEGGGQSEPPTPSMSDPKTKRKSRKLKRSLRAIDWNPESPPSLAPEIPFSRSNLVAPSSPIDLSFLHFPPMPSKRSPFPVGRNVEGQSRFSSMTSFDLETIQKYSPRIPTTLGLINPPDVSRNEAVKQSSKDSIVDPFLSPHPGGLGIATFSPSMSVGSLDVDKTPKVGSRPPAEFRSLLLVEIQKQQLAASTAETISVPLTNPLPKPTLENRRTAIEETFSTTEQVSYTVPKRESSRQSFIRSHRPSLDGSWAAEEEDFISRYLEEWWNNGLDR